MKCPQFSHCRQKWQINVVIGYVVQFRVSISFEWMCIVRMRHCRPCFQWVILWFFDRCSIWSWEGLSEIPRRWCDLVSRIKGVEKDRWHHCPLWSVMKYRTWLGGLVKVFVPQQDPERVEGKTYVDKDWQLSTAAVDLEAIVAGGWGPLFPSV